MKQLILLWLIILPAWAMTQDIKNGAISIDFGKRKKQATDTVQQVAPGNDEDDTAAVKRTHPKKQFKPVSEASQQNDWYDYKKDGVFSGLFHAGFNAAQIDGDFEYGYKYFGAEGGIGALARFHKIISLSVELDYTMLGARARLPASTTNLEKYNVQLDYLEVPVAVNFHYKKWLMASIGVAPGYLTRYKEFDYDGINITNQPNQLGEPNKFGMAGFAALHYIIKEHYAIGGQFAYGVLKIRGAEPGTRVNGEYNNYLTFEFLYILNQVKKKK